jgi:arylsulfatase A-like enzyme/Tfp pilus assembly protein PilF
MNGRAGEIEEKKRTAVSGRTGLEQGVVDKGMRPARAPEMRRRHRLLGIFLTLAALASACRDEVGGGEPPPAPRPPAAEQRDLLIVTIDTARADRFSHLGDSPVRTVVVDAVAAEGAAFGQAISPVPVTLPAHVSLFTGRNPPSHAVRSNGVYFLSETEQTLAVVLKQAGYSTAAFVGAAVLDARYGLDQGFDHYDDRVDLTDEASSVGSYAQRRGEDVVMAALRWLSGVPEQATFVWIHLYDPHIPYRPPEPERHRHSGSPYDGEIAYVDRVIGVLLEGYEKLGRYGGAVVVITADHGEGLGQHGESTHGLFVYDTTLRVPLVIKGPGVPAGVRLDHPVSLVDVVPTVCALLGVPPPNALDGRSLLPLIEGREEEADERWIYFESLYPYVHYGWADYRGVRSAAWKLIEGRSTQLYHIGVEPEEKLDLAGTRPETVAELSAQLSGLIAGEEDIAASRLQLDAESRHALAALGYAQSEFVAEAGPRSERPDPRERIQILDAFDRATASFTRGERARGLALAEEVARAAPESADFARRLAHMCRVEGRIEQALAEYRRAVALDPRDVDSWSSLGEILQGLGRNEDAIVAYERAIALQPNHRNSRHNRWILLLGEGRKQEVAADASLAIEREPGDGEAQWASIMARYDSATP